MDENKALYEGVAQMYKLKDGAFELVDNIGLRYGNGFETRDACWESLVRFTSMLQEAGVFDVVINTCRVIGG